MTSPLPVVCTQPGSCFNRWSKIFCLRSASTWRPTPKTNILEISRTPPITVASTTMSAA